MDETQHHLEEQILEVKNRHKQQVVAELAAAKKAEEKLQKWKAEEAQKDAVRKDAMLKLKASAYVCIFCCTAC